MGMMGKSLPIKERGGVSFCRGGSSKKEKKRGKLIGLSKRKNVEIKHQFGENKGRQAKEKLIMGGKD